jgi:hypothetical protein
MDNDLKEYKSLKVDFYYECMVEIEVIFTYKILTHTYWLQLCGALYYHVCKYSKWFVKRDNHYCNYEYADFWHQCTVRQDLKQIFNMYNIRAIQNAIKLTEKIL